MIKREIIGLHKKPALIAVGASVLTLLALLLPMVSLGGKTMGGFSLAFAVKGGMSFFYPALAVLAVLCAVMGVVLFFMPSVKGVRLWSAFMALEVICVTVLLFGSKMIIDANSIFSAKFLVKNFGIGFWLILVLSYVGLWNAMNATRVSPGHIILVVLSIIWLFPIAWVVLTSLRAEPGYYVDHFIPHGFTLDNYINLFKAGSPIPFARWWTNTFIVAAVSCVLNTLIVLMTSYALSRQRFKGRQLLMKAMMVIGMFPGFMSMIAVYNILKGMGIAQNLGALILVNVASSAMGYYICKGFLDTVPKALDEAAHIDGATNFTIFYKIMIPMAKPIIIYQLMSAFIGPWGDYIFPSLLLGDKQQSYTVAIGLKWLTDQQRIESYYTQFAAGAVLVSIPIVVLFSLLQRYYVEGMSGAVKG